ncbi:hypothetical protein [Shewanella sp.]|uniref:hypothetical protein n=1 Tax=Shewanella sp. TaxID=50422 RepID=UPI003A97BC9D
MKYPLIPLAAVVLLCGCGPSIPESSALQCYNPNFYQAGNQLTLATYIDGRMQSVQQWQMKAAQYQGQAAIVTELSTNSLQHPQQFQRWASRYNQVDAEQSQFLALAVEFNNQHEFGPVSRVFSPAVPESFNFITAGDAVDTRYQTTEHSLTFGVEFTETQQYRRTTRFMGMESITTPAGSFDTCHLQYTKQRLSATDDDQEQPAKVEDAWYAKQSGIPVKLANTDGVYQLLLEANVAGMQVSLAPDIRRQFSLPSAAAAQ